MYVEQASSRAAAVYMTYAKDYAAAAQSLRFALSNGLDLSPSFFSSHQIFALLSQPFMRLGEYGVMLAPIVDDLDERGKKKIVSAMRSLDQLFRKCRAVAMPTLYSK